MDGFEVNPEDTRAQWEEAVRMIPRMWTEETFSHEGQFFTIPPRSVIPKPVQDPHPPMWVACSQPDSFRAAGEMGLGVLCFNLGGYAQMEERVAAYRAAVKNANPVGRFVNDQVAALCLVHVGEDDEEARRVASPEGEWFVNKAEELYQPWQGSECSQLLPVRRERSPGGTGKQDGRGPHRLRRLCQGQPDTVIKVLKKYEEAGVDQILCFMQMGNLAHSRIMDSIKLFARHVMPYFK